MKIMLFLFPIEEYIKMLCEDRPEVLDLLNESINTRYREKGYNIVFLTFKNKPIYGVNIFPNDKIIESNITFEEHITPIEKDENGKDKYQYSSNDYIEKSIGNFEELIVCGFHVQDCVMRVANHFYNINHNTLVDEELTNFFGTLSRRFYFNPAKYNLANRLTYDEAEDMLMHRKPYFERSMEPYFHTDKFKSDFTVEECMNKLLEIKEQKRQNRVRR